MQSPTNATTQQILRFLFEQGAFCWRQGASGIPMPGGGFRPSGKVGVTDILGIFKSLALAIEVKTGKDRLSPEQEGFLASFKASGGLSMVVHSYDDFLLQWNKLLKNGIIKP